MTRKKRKRLRRIPAAAHRTDKPCDWHEYERFKRLAAACDLSCGDYARVLRATAWCWTVLARSCKAIPSNAAISAMRFSPATKSCMPPSWDRAESRPAPPAASPSALLPTGRNIATGAG